MQARLPPMVLAFMTLFCLPRFCEGGISYTWVNQGMYTAGGPVTYELDFNQDSIIDLLFESTGMWFDVDPLSNNRVIAGGGDVYALPEGYSIGPNIESNLWQQGQFGLTLNTCAVLPPPYGVTCSGQFIGTTAYMGVKFYISDYEHYGWVRISNPWEGISGGVILDFAYETTPGVGILAGAVPEPTTVGLLSVGLLVFIFQQRRSRKKPNHRLHHYG